MRGPELRSSATPALPRPRRLRRGRIRRSREPSATRAGETGGGYAPSLFWPATARPTWAGSPPPSPRPVCGCADAKAPGPLPTSRYRANRRRERQAGHRLGDPAGPQPLDGAQRNEHNAVRGTAAVVLVCHDVQGPTAAAAEHACKAASIGFDSIEHPTPRGNPRTALARDAGAPDSPSASAQIPSGAAPGPRSAQTRRSTSSPGSVIVTSLGQHSIEWWLAVAPEI